MKSEVVFSFGVISDVQYADCNDRLPVHTSKTRYYRNSLTLTKDAVSEWTDNDDIKFILQLGDLIDGKSKEEAHDALDRTLTIFAGTEKPTYHSLGNHELYNFSHHTAADKLMQCVTNRFPGKGYYSFMYKNFRFICLDTYDISVLGKSESEVAYRQARELLAVNCNEDQNSPSGLAESDRRFVVYNGGIGDEQLAWLRGELDQSQIANEKVIVFGK